MLKYQAWLKCKEDPKLIASILRKKLRIPTSLIAKQEFKVEMSFSMRKDFENNNIIDINQNNKHVRIVTINKH